MSLGDEGRQENENYALFNLGYHLEIDYKIDCLGLVSVMRARPSFDQFPLGLPFRETLF